MEQTKALNALEPFLALTKSASSPRAAADLITRATSAPQTFIFSELLAAPQIQALANSLDHSSYLSLLKIFSYGTCTDYKASSGLPPLNEPQILKLRQLSFLTLAKNPSDLTYANLMQKLDLQTARELEDLVISAIYAGLVQGTLDPYNQLILISSVSPLRDLSPNSIPSMLGTLNEWSTRCSTTLTDLEKQIASIKADALKRHKEEQEWAAHVDKLLDLKPSDKIHNQGQGEESGSRWGFGRKLGGGTGKRLQNGGLVEGYSDDDMDVDDEDEDDGEKRSKKRGFGTLSFGK